MFESQSHCRAVVDTGSGLLLTAPIAQIPRATQQNKHVHGDGGGADRVQEGREDERRGGILFLTHLHN